MHEQPSSQAPRASASHIWMRILLWLVPGFAATGIVFEWVMSSFATLRAHQDLILIGSLITLLVVTLCAGAFDCVLHLTRTRGRQNVRIGIVVGWTIAFGATQLLIVPVILLTAVLACSFAGVS